LVGKCKNKNSFQHLLLETFLKPLLSFE